MTRGQIIYCLTAFSAQVAGVLGAAGILPLVWVVAIMSALGVWSLVLFLAERRP